MNTASQMHQSTLNTQSYEHTSTMNEANQVNTNRMNTATSMQSSQHNYNNNNYNNGNYNNNGGYHYGNPYGGCCYGSSNSGGSGSNVGAALGGMAVGAMVASLPREAAPVYAPGPTPYYYSNGGFVAPVQAGGYQVVAPPAGAMVPSPPSGAYQTTCKRRHILCVGVDVLRTCLQQWRGRLQSRTALTIDSAPVATKVDSDQGRIDAFPALRQADFAKLKTGVKA